ncbi:hypothetical protein U1Q18_044390 [Sarracenia purpurea var. burkii]
MTLACLLQVKSRLQWQRVAGLNYIAALVNPTRRCYSASSNGETQKSKPSKRLSLSKEKKAAAVESFVKNGDISRRILILRRWSCLRVVIAEIPLNLTIIVYSANVIGAEDSESATHRDDTQKSGVTIAILIKEGIDSERISAEIGKTGN